MQGGCLIFQWTVSEHGLGAVQFTVLTAEGAPDLGERIIPAPSSALASAWLLGGLTEGSALGGVPGTPVSPISASSLRVPLSSALSPGKQRNGRLW